MDINLNISQNAGSFRSLESREESLQKIYKSWEASNARADEILSRLERDDRQREDWQCRLPDHGWAVIGEMAEGVLIGMVIAGSMGTFIGGAIGRAIGIAKRVLF